MSKTASNHLILMLRSVLKCTRKKFKTLIFYKINLKIMGVHVLVHATVENITISVKKSSFYIHLTLV